MKRLILAAILILGFAYFGYYQHSVADDNDDKNAVLVQVLMQGLEQLHYEPKSINNDFSKKVFEQYLKSIDVYKLFFTKQDYEKLKSYQYLVDDEIKNGTLQLVNLSHEILQNRIGQVRGYYEEVLRQPLDYTLDERIEFDYDKLDYPEDEEALKNRWRKFSKYYALSRLYDLKQANSEPIEGESKSFDEMEAKARERVADNFDDWFNRLQQLEKRDRLSDFLNAITSVYDPHTNYYAPKDKEDFDIEFSGKLEGIGARLQEKDGYISVQMIVPGSASWRQGDLEAGDKILKVTQEDEEPVDIVGMRIDDAVQLIRGKKGTIVTLTVQKLDGVIMDIEIERDVVVFQETYAKSAVIEKDMKAGYIKLPSFYADFNSEGNGRRCAVDVKKELIKLKGEGVEAVILDLRNNGGGSLADVVEMAGLFIETGPVVQVKARNSKPIVLKDEDPSVVYEGPLVILVNSFSASASEILAAAMQDYGRAIIIGSGSHTFGKGTVQRIYDIDNWLSAQYDNEKPFGSIMLTVQKFYRIDGTTNQLKGVEPDIVLPDRFTYVDYGEKDLEYAIPWDEIQAASFERSDFTDEELEEVRKISNLRVQSNNKFRLIDENAQSLKDQRDKTSYTLNYEEYAKQRQDMLKQQEKYESLQEEIEGLDVYSLQADKLEEAKDSVQLKLSQKLHKALKKDIYVDEAIRILEEITNS